MSEAEDNRSCALLESQGNGKFQTRPLADIHPAIFGRITDPAEQQKMLDDIDSYLSYPGIHDKALMAKMPQQAKLARYVN